MSQKIIYVLLTIMLGALFTSCATEKTANDDQQASSSSLGIIESTDGQKYKWDDGAEVDMEEISAILVSDPEYSLEIAGTVNENGEIASGENNRLGWKTSNWGFEVGRAECSHPLSPCVNQNVCHIHFKFKWNGVWKVQGHLGIYKDKWTQKKCLVWWDSVGGGICLKKCAPTYRETVEWIQDRVEDALEKVVPFAVAATVAVTVAYALATVVWALPAVAI